ncbi:hypothetical protein D7Y15_39650 [Corallococcus sp. AB030]|uniref:LysR substrate-binding domain-containing protein n=1 Tax=Corallococcus sp. AB030 TaxID=2316716 RepID=UPI000EEC6D18|nr:LysR substrate-binding domain-containing protein [Corallococcus sp. AB030]RKH98439.1 hypothetical protein D7Y15_39650 [Corallococcus sp. AB030]
MARRGVPRATEDLTSHDFVAYRGLKHLGALGLPEKHAHVLADDMLFLREAAKAGAGIALLPSFLALADVTSGQLVRVMPRYTLSTTSLTMLPPAPSTCRGRCPPSATSSSTSSRRGPSPRPPSPS